MQKKKYSLFFWQILLSYCCGLLAIFAFAPYGIWPLAIVSPLLLLILWSQYSKNKAISTYFFGCGYFSGGYWVFYSIYNYTSLGISYSILLSMCFISILATSFLLIHAFTQLLPGNEYLRRYLYFPCGWGTAELIRTKSSLAYPWLLLAYSQSNSPLLSIAKITGILTTSMILVLLASLCYDCFTNRSIKIKLVAVFSITLIFVISTAIPLQKRIETKKQDVLLVQPNISQQDKWQNSFINNKLDEYNNIIKDNITKNMLVVFPETIIPFVPKEAEEKVAVMSNLLKDYSANAVIGSITSRNGKLFNSAIITGSKIDVVSKHKLVAFGETDPGIPYIDQISKLLGYRMASMSVAEKVQTAINLNGLKVAILICYEVAFPDETLQRIADADIMIVISDDIWFGNSNAVLQHRQIAEFYANIMKIPLLFVNNNGGSAVIRNGKVLAELPLANAGIIKYSLSL